MVVIFIWVPYQNVFYSTNLSILIVRWSLFPNLPRDGLQALDRGRWEGLESGLNKRSFGLQEIFPEVSIVFKRLLFWWRNSHPCINGVENNSFWVQLTVPNDLAGNFKKKLWSIQQGFKSLGAFLSSLFSVSVRSKNEFFPNRFAINPTKESAIALVAFSDQWSLPQFERKCTDLFVCILNGHS